MEKDILWINDPSRIRIYQVMDTLECPTVVSYAKKGWLLDPDDNRHDFHLCCAESEEWCDAIPVWRIIRKVGPIVSCGYYCDAHLSPDLMRPGKRRNLTEVEKDVAGDLVELGG